MAVVEMGSWSSKPGDGGESVFLSADGKRGERWPGETSVLETLLLSFSRKKSRFDSTCVLTGRGRELVWDRDFTRGSSISKLGRRPSSDGLEEDGCGWR